MWKRRLIGPDEISRAAAELSGGAGGSSETVEAIRALPADQKLALIAAYQLAGGQSLVIEGHSKTCFDPFDAVFTNGCPAMVT